MEELRRLIRKAGCSRSPVLLLGESGTGKEIVARSIHLADPSGEFVPIDCSLLGTLLETELFGHTKGAFTGAIANKPGLIALAEGGTAFFDEIAEFPLQMQVKLLRVLQEKKIRQVGSLELRAANFRVIAATNRDLDKAIADGSFRRDLYYRLSVFPIEMPPLRDRAEDIPLLVEYLTHRYATKAGKRIANVSRKTIDLLTAYDWPGNIRELQNVIQRAVILCDETLVVDESWLDHAPARSTGALHILGRPSISEEKKLIESALAESCGRVAGPDGAAVRLGIPRSTLESKIRSLHIEKNRFRTK